MSSKPFLIPGILEALPESIALRHHLHANPELAFEEFATSQLVAEKLRSYGYDVHQEIGKTGVVGVLKKGTSKRSLGIRADMDALPIHEQTGLPYASRIPGKMHACGHDGHTASLLAAARYLAADGKFNGVLNLIFQPAEEGQAGALRMLEDGLLQKFPCDAVFAYHNLPGYPVGKVGSLPGHFMASSDTVIINVHGKGGHGSMPHATVDATMVAAYITVAMQTVVARNVDPRQMAVVTVGSLNSGEASNVISERAEMKLTVRAYDPAVRALLRERITEVAQNQAKAMGASVEIDYQWRYPPLKNDPAMTRFALKVAEDRLGKAGMIHNMEPLTSSEDFAYILDRCPGSYVIIGNGLEGEKGGCSVHNPRYDFNDDILAFAASYWAHLAQDFLG